MSTIVNITDTDNWFIGEDKIFRFVVKDAAGLPINMTTGAYVTRFFVRRKVDDADPATLIKNSAAAEITYVNVDGTADGADVKINAEDTLDQSVDPAVILVQPGLYHIAFKKINENDETVLAAGTAVLKLSASR